MGQYLVIGDTDQIQQFVFASRRLRTIRGSSALLETAIGEFVESNTGIADFLRWRGGQVVAILRTDDSSVADDFCARLEAAVRQKSANAASITTTFVEYHDGHFHQALEQAFKTIRVEKDSRQTRGSEGTAVFTGPYHHRCDLLPTQPAVTRKTVGDIGEEEEHYLSESARARWPSAGSSIGSRYGFDRELLDRLEELSSKPFGGSCTFPYQPDDLWAQDEGGYMGYVAADGNGIGQMLEVIKDEKLYKDFSKDMYELILNTIAQASKAAGICEPFEKVKKNKRGKKKQYSYLPLAPVIVAGDDMSLLARAEMALPLAEHLCSNFVDLSKEQPSIQSVAKNFCSTSPTAARRLFPGYFPDNEAMITDESQPFTLSAGVAIAKRKFPISVYRRLAGELRDQAKQTLYQHPELIRDGGMIDFAVITTATAQSLVALRNRYCIEEDTRLTLRPYTLENFRKMCHLADLLAECLPRSKRKLLYSKLFTGRAVGEAAYRFLLARMDKSSCEKITDAMNELNCSDDKAFRRASPPVEWETPLVDALEVAELKVKEA